MSETYNTQDFVRSLEGATLTPFSTGTDMYTATTSDLGTQIQYTPGSMAVTLSAAS